jgi:hypothetical protein
MATVLIVEDDFALAYALDRALRSSSWITALRSIFMIPLERFLLSTTLS